MKAADGRDFVGEREPGAGFPSSTGGFLAVQRNLVAIAALPVLTIWRYLWSFNDQQPFGGQGGEDRGGVHFHRKSEEHKEGKKVT